MNNIFSTAKMVIYPSYYEGKNGIRYNAVVMQPTQINLDVSKQVSNPRNLEAVLKTCADNEEQVEIDFVAGKDNFGNPLMTVFDVKPVNKVAKS